MINFVLYDLRCPTREILGMRFHFKRLKLHLDSLIALTLTRAAEKRQAAFLGVIRAIFLDDFRIEHYRVDRSSPALIEESDDPLTSADHIRRHADTAFSVRHQRIKQVLRDLQIFFRRDL